MADIEHGDLTADGIPSGRGVHPQLGLPDFADQAARLAFSQSALDRGRMAWQLSDGTMWVADGAGGWKQVDGAGGGSSPNDIILDPLGVAGGAIYTTYDTAIVEAVARGAITGECRVHVLSDVTVSAGTYGAGMGRVRLIGKTTGSTALNPSGQPPVITFDGTTVHTDWPRSVTNLGLATLGATVTPYPQTVVEAKIVMDLRGVLLLAGGPGVPVFDVASASDVVINAATCAIGNGGGNEVITVSDAGARLNFFAQDDDEGLLIETIFDLIVAGDGPIDSDAFTSIVGSEIVLYDVGDSQQMRPPYTGVLGSLVINAWPNSADGRGKLVSGATTIFNPNEYVLFQGTPGAYTLTLDFSQYGPVPDNFMRFEGTGSMSTNIVTLSLTGGESFANGGTTRELNIDNGVWRMERAVSGDWHLIYEQTPAPPMWTKLETKTVTGAAVQSLAFDVPDGADLQIRFSVLATSGASGLVYIRPNGVDQGITFTRSRHFMTNTGTNTITLNDTNSPGALFGDLTADVELVGYGNITHAVSGQVHFDIEQQIFPPVGGSTVTQYSKAMSRWRVPASMTSIDFQAVGGTYLEVGSTITIYRLTGN